MLHVADVLHSSQRSSEIFRALPFNTTSLFDVTNLCELSDTTGQLEEYLRKLQEDEKRWHKPNSPFAIFSAAMKDGTPAGQNEALLVMAFPTLMRYRIIDTALFKDSNAHLRVPMIRSYLEGKKIQPLTKLGLEKLKDVKKFVLHANKLISKASPIASALDIPIGSSERLFASICKRAKKRAMENIFLNVETAAFHLSFLLEGHSDLPESTESLKAYFRKKSKIDNQVWAFFQKNIFELKGPLYIAMAISPLLLLSSRNLQNNPPGKEALFNFWCISGQYERPKSVLSAEKELWNVIWDIAAGMDTYNRLRTGIDKLMELDFRDVGEWELTKSHSTKLPLLHLPHQPRLPLGRPKVGRWARAGEAGQREGMAQRSDLSSPEPHDESVSFAQHSIPPAFQASGLATAIIQSSATDSSDDDDDDNIIFRSIIKNPKRIILQQEISLSDLISSTLEEEQNRMGRIDIYHSSPKIVGPTPLHVVTNSQSCPVVGLPTTHFKMDLDWIYDIYGSAGSADNPSIGEMSSIMRLSYQEYKSMDPKKIGNYFSKSSILVTGVPVISTASHPSFSDALKLLGQMDEDIVIEDQSIKVQEEEQVIQGPNTFPESNRSFSRHKVGTLKDILQSLNVKHPKSLNALLLPRSTQPCDHYPLFTDRVAWDNSYRKAGKIYPEDEMRWLQVATPWAHQKWHLDSDGFATFIQVNFGTLLYFIGNPKRNLPHNLLPGGIDRFLGKFNQEQTNSDILDIELVVLQPGDLLFVRPTTLHAVVNPVPTVVCGGHLYATSSIRATCYGIYDSFVTGSYVTNTSHAAASNSLISRLLDFYYRGLVAGTGRHGKGVETDRKSIHLPDLRNFQEVVDMFTLLHLIELSNAISNWNYQNSSTPAAVENRLQAIKNRQVARKIKKWYFARYLLEGLENHLTAEEVLNQRFLAQQAMALSNYKRRAWEQGKSQGGVAQITPEMVDVAICESLMKTPVYRHYINASSEVCTFEWDGLEYLSRMRRDDDVIGPAKITFSEDEEASYTSGLTFGDICFFKKLERDYEENQKIAKFGDEMENDLENDLEWLPQKRKRATRMDGSNASSSLKHPRLG